MTPEKLKQLKEIVEHFRGKETTDEAILKFCTEKGYEGIDAGTVEDYTFQLDADELTQRVVPKIGELLKTWKVPSSFTPSVEQQAQANVLSRDILALFEEENTQFLLATSVLDSLASNLSGIIRGASQRSTDVKLAIANTYLIRKFGADPLKICVGDMEKERKVLLDLQ